MKITSRFTKRYKAIPAGRFFVVLVSLLAVGSLLFVNTHKTFAAPGPITGLVFSDVNGNGIKDTGEGAFSNLAIVNLYNSSGTYVKSRTSDASGNFSLAGLSAGTYYISLYNITRPALLNSPPGLINDINVKVEQTYGAVGSGAGSGSGPVCVGAAPNYTTQDNYTSSPSEWSVGAQNGTSSGQCFGGRKAAMTSSVLTALTPLTYTANSDFTTGNAALNTQKAVTKVVLTSSGGVSNVDFGASTSVVTNTSASGQGSLAQFIANANAMGGTQTMRFVPSVATNQGSGANKWWQINQGSTPLATITNNSTTLDGRALSNTDGTTQLDTNTGVLAGATVGTTQYHISDYQKPELEVVGDVRANGGSTLIGVTGSDVAISNFGFNSTVDYPGNASYFVQQSAGTNMTVSNDLMGVNVATGASYSTRPQFAIQTAYLLSLNVSGRYTHNYMSTNDSRGMVMANGLLGAGNVQPLVLGDWAIEENDGPSAGVAFGAGTTRISIKHNNMPNAWLDASSSNVSLGLHTLTENTISDGSGVVLFAGLQNTITKNIIKNATGSNPGISVGNLSTGNYISQNSFSGNGGNAIDLNSDGVSDNDLLSCLTLSPTHLLSLANLGIARPTLLNAKLQGSTLKLDINYCGIGVFNVEIYKAAAGSGDSNAGEGAAYMGTFTSLNLLNGTVPNQSMTVSNLQPGDAITAIVIDPVTGETSEFSPNVVAASPPAAPATAPDMTSGTDTGSSNTDNITNDKTPTFTGSCTDGQTVTLYVDGSAIAPAQVCSGGSYSIAPIVSMIDGPHTINSTFTNNSGESDKGPSLGFSIDSTASPALDAPDMTVATDTGVSSTDNITKNTQPTFTGSCTNGDTVTLLEGSNVIGIQACTNGSYTIQLTTALGEGGYSITAKATDVAGNQSGVSVALSIAIDTTAPSAPTITTPATGITTNASTPHFAGTGESGATVTVKDNNGATICVAVVTGGLWACDATTPIGDGAYRFVAAQTDSAGNTSPISSETALTIDTLAPGAPVVVSPADGVQLNNTHPTLHGTADASATVHLFLNGSAYATVTADASGNWTYAPSDALADGNYSLSATQQDAAGNSSVAASLVHFIIDTVRPTVTVEKKAGQADPTSENSASYTVTFSEAINAGSFSPADITINSSPTTTVPYVSSFAQVSVTSWEITIASIPNHTTVSASLGANVVTDPAGNGNTASTSSDNSVLYDVDLPNVTHQITNQTKPDIDGECVANHQLQLVINGASQYTYATACSSGVWTFAVPDTLVDGTYTIVVTDTTTGDLINPETNQTGALVIDTVRPTLTVNQASDQKDPTNQNDAHFVVISSEPLASGALKASAFEITGTSGTATVTQRDETTWDVDVTGMSSGDIVHIAVAVNAVKDLAGNNNIASTSSDNSVTFDNSPPDKPVITSPANNSLNNNGKPTITGIGENGASLTIKIDGSVIVCAEGDSVIVRNGTWSCTPVAALSDNEHVIIALLTDPAGNQSDPSSGVTVTIDTIAPASPLMPTLGASSDTGGSNSDAITSETHPTFIGTCVTDSIVTVYDGQNQIAQGACSNGVYSLSTASLLSEGQRTITATFTDTAGNASVKSPALILTIDTTPPAVPDIASPNEGTTQGSSAVVISGQGEPGAVLAVTVDGNAVGCDEAASLVVAQDGTWICTLDIALGDGNHTVIVTQQDIAGNVSAGVSRHLTIDTTPPARPSAPRLESSSDTGSSNTDDLTFDTTPTLGGTCETGATIILYDGDDAIASGACVSGAYTITPTSALAEGAYDFSVSAKDSLGNESQKSAVTTVVIDVTPPVTPIAPDMTAATDSGISQTDNLTNGVRPAFTGACTTGETITLFVDDVLAGQTVCGSAVYTTSPVADLSEGAHQVRVTATDIAGNVSPKSMVLDVIIDTSAPTAPMITAPANNFATNQTSVQIDGTGENGSSVTVSLNSMPASCSEGAITVTSGQWHCTLSSLADSVYQLTAVQVDAAGNSSEPSVSTQFTVDTVPPSAPSEPAMTPSSDTGTSNTDTVTNDAQPYITGTCLSGVTVTLYVDDVAAGSIVCTNGTYSIRPNMPLSSGVHHFSVTFTDHVGNVSPKSTTLDITIDTVPPDTLAAPVLASSSDSGMSQADRITNIVKPHMTGSCVTGDTIQLFADGVLVGQVDCQNGTYDVAPTNDLSDGAHNLQTGAIDSAGNVGALSVATSVTIDTISPATPTIITPSNGDTVTTDTPVIEGTGEDGAVPAIEVDDTLQICGSGSTSVVTNGSWKCIPSAPINNGPHTLSASQADPAGNVSPATTSMMTVDTTPPATLDAPDMAAATDTGASNTDNITSVTVPVFAGSCFADTMIKLYVDSTLVAQGSCSANAYMLTSSQQLAEGAHDVTATATNDSGNTSAVSAALHIVISTATPTTPQTPDLTSATDSGRSATDDITNNSTPHFAGTCDGVSVEVYQATTMIGQASCSGGAYEVQPAAPLSDATYQISIVVISVSGVRSQQSAQLSVTIDTVLPAAPVIAVPSNNLLTNNNKPTMNGTGESSAILTVYANNNAFDCSQASPLLVDEGAWTCSPANALADGTYTVKATQTDIAGNTSLASAVKTITIDTVAPTRLSRPDLTAATDSGSSNTDNITNVTLPNLVGSCVTGDVIKLRLDGVVTSQMTCANDGYSLFPASALTAGTYNFSAVATDPAGNTSSVGFSLTVTIATNAPKPSMPYLHPDSDNGRSQTDNITNITLPTITGICNPNETVYLTIDGVFQRSVPCYPPFYGQPLDQLSQGNHLVTIRVTDIAGNMSPVSDTLTITIDTTAPGNPTVTTPASDTTPLVTTSAYTMAGTTEPNAQIVIWENDTNKCSSYSDTNGSWSCTLTGLTNGAHTYVFSANDVAGNPGPHIVTRSITVNHP